MAQRRVALRCDVLLGDVLGHERSVVDGRAGTREQDFGCRCYFDQPSDKPIRRRTPCPCSAWTPASCPPPRPAARSPTSSRSDWLAAHPGDDVVRRHVGTEPLPSDAWAAAVAGSHTPEDQRTPEQRAALALAADAGRRADRRRRGAARRAALQLRRLPARQDLGRPGHHRPRRRRRPPRSPASRSCSPPCAAAPTARAPRARAGTTPPATCAASSPTSGAPT